VSHHITKRAAQGRLDEISVTGYNQSMTAATGRLFGFDDTIINGTN
jgi:hypothetical protein